MSVLFTANLVPSILQSTSSDKTLPDQLEFKGRTSSSGGGGEFSVAMMRQPSLSKALEEWDIPYEELIIEEELGAGHVATVYR